MSDPLKPAFQGLAGQFAALERRANAVQSLTTLVRESLPEALRAHVLTAVRRGEDLVVVVDSAAWSARVRYAGPRLRETLHVQGETVPGKVRVRVGAATSATPATP